MGTKSILRGFLPLASLLPSSALARDGPIDAAAAQYFREARATATTSSRRVSGER